MNDSGVYRTVGTSASLSTLTNGITNIQLVDDEGVPIETDAFLVEGLGGAEEAEIEYMATATASISDNIVTVTASME